MTCISWCSITHAMLLHLWDHGSWIAREEGWFAGLDAAGLLLWLALFARTCSCAGRGRFYFPWTTGRRHVCTHGLVAGKEMSRSSKPEWFVRESLHGSSRHVSMDGELFRVWLDRQ